MRVHWKSVLLLGALLAGCSGSEAPAPAGSQVVARIGPDVVTVQELENEMRVGNVAPERRKDPEVVRKLVGDLVARKLMARRAVTSKLDREPTVLLDLLRSKDVVLAEAAVARAVNTKIAAITSADVEKYIQGNPLKFSNRRILLVDQLVVPLSAASDTLVEASRSAASLDEVAQKLSGMSVPFARTSGTFSTADLPQELTDAFRAQTADGVVFVRLNQNGAFLKIRSQEARPLTGVAAEAAARQFMRADLAKSEASLAAFTANLEATYVGDYAKLMATK